MVGRLFVEDEYTINVKVKHPVGQDFPKSFPSFTIDCEEDIPSVIFDEEKKIIDIADPHPTITLRDKSTSYPEDVRLVSLSPNGNLQEIGVTPSNYEEYGPIKLDYVESTKKVNGKVEDTRITLNKGGSLITLPRRKSMLNNAYNSNDQTSTNLNTSLSKGWSIRSHGTSTGGNSTPPFGGNRRGTKINVTLRPTSPNSSTLSADTTVLPSCHTMVSGVIVPSSYTTMVQSNCKTVIDENINMEGEENTNVVNGSLELPLVQVFADDNSLVAKNKFRTPKIDVNKIASRADNQHERNGITKVQKTGSLFVPPISAHCPSSVGELFIAPVSAENIRNKQQFEKPVKGNSRRKKKNDNISENLNSLNSNLSGKFNDNKINNSISNTQFKTVNSSSTPISHIIPPKSTFQNNTFETDKKSSRIDESFSYPNQNQPKSNQENYNQRMPFGTYNNLDNEVKTNGFYSQSQTDFEQKSRTNESLSTSHSYSVPMQNQKWNESVKIDDTQLKNESFEKIRKVKFNLPSHDSSETSYCSSSDSGEYPDSRIKARALITEVLKDCMTPMSPPIYGSVNNKNHSAFRYNNTHHHENQNIKFYKNNPTKNNGQQTDDIEYDNYYSVQDDYELPTNKSRINRIHSPFNIESQTLGKYYFDM